MSRSGYNEDSDDQWSFIRWRGAVTSAIKGKRGQQFFRDLIDALDAMPVKRLIANSLIEPSGEVCAMGAVAKARKIDLTGIETFEAEDTLADDGRLADRLNIAQPLSQEVAWMNDEAGPWKETPEDRYIRIRKWAEKQLRAALSQKDESR